MAWIAIACATLTGADELEVGDRDAGDGASATTNFDATADREGVDGEVLDPQLSACGAGVCVITEGGWSPIVQPSSGTSTCPTAWATSASYTTASAMSCKCSCRAASGSCEGPLSVASGGVSCNNGGADTLTLPGDGGCTTTSLNTATFFKLTPNPASPPSSCTPEVETSGGGTEAVKLCTGGSIDPSPDCKSGQACVPRASRATMCVVHAGDVACPSGFGRRMLVGSGVDSDNRACGSCACAADNCTHGTVEAFNTQSCSFMVQTIPLGLCQLGIGGAASLRYRAGTGCAVAQPPTVTGAATLTELQTLCCNRSSGGD